MLGHGRGDRDPIGQRGPPGAREAGQQSRPVDQAVAVFPLLLADRPGDERPGAGGLVQGDQQVGQVERGDGLGAAEPAGTAVADDPFQTPLRLAEIARQGRELADELAEADRRVGLGVEPGEGLDLVQGVARLVQVAALEQRGRSFEPDRQLGPAGEVGRVTVGRVATTPIEGAERVGVLAQAREEPAQRQIEPGIEDRLVSPGERRPGAGRLPGEQGTRAQLDLVEVAERALHRAESVHGLADRRAAEGQVDPLQRRVVGRHQVTGPGRERDIALEEPVGGAALPERDREVGQAFDDDEVDRPEARVGLRRRLAEILQPASEDLRVGVEARPPVAPPPGIVGRLDRGDDRGVRRGPRAHGAPAGTIA